MKIFTRIFNKHLLALLVLLIVAVIPRFIWLQSIPTGISDDELGYIFNAKALYYTGAGLTGGRSPFVLSPNFPNAELISVFIAPIVGPLPFTLFTARFLFAFVGCANVFLLFFLTRKIIGEKEAWCVGFLATLNPWNIFFSRTTIDPPITTFFLLLALYLMVSLKDWQKLWATAALGIGLFTYMGMAVIFPFFTIISVAYSWIRDKRKGIIQYAAILGIAALLFLRFVFVIQHLGTGSRTNELFTPLASGITAEVNTQRRVSVTSPLTTLYANKISVFATEALRKYLNAFSPNLLLLDGDPRPIFAVRTHGLFYISDVLLFIVGGWILWKKHKQIFWLLFGLLLIAPLPSVVSAETISYAARSYLMQPVLLILAGSGLAHGIELVRRKKLSAILGVIFFIIFALEIFHFGLEYFLKNPVDNSESYNFSTRIMATYAQKELETGRQVIVLSGIPGDSFRQYLLYSNKFNKDSAKAIAGNYVKQQFHFGGFSSAVCPGVSTDLSTATIIVAGDNPCKTYIPTGIPLVIPILRDAGSVYKIYNGQTCSQNALERFPHDIHFSDFQIEGLSKDNFCTKFIIRY